jgi:hypothetical protein
LKEKFCPLVLESMEDREPDECTEQCAELWESAIAKGQTEGPYDLYGAEEEENCNADTEGADISLTATSEHARVYVVADTCQQHGTAVGEQGYIFRCPRRLFRGETE